MTRPVAGILMWGGGAATSNKDIDQNFFIKALAIDFLNKGEVCAGASAHISLTTNLIGMLKYFYRALLSPYLVFLQLCYLKLFQLLY